MKRVDIIAVIISLLVSLCSCTTKQLTIEQSKKNFSIYQSSLQKVADSYDLKLISTKDEDIENQDLYSDYIITVSSNIYIYIRIINSAYESKKGVESFSIDYHINNEGSENDFNIQLFVDLANCISGEPISADFCEEFLNAPESKYSAEEYGYEKLNGETIAKAYPLNYFEDWEIFYILDKDNEETLSFGGLTKQIT